MRPHQRILHRQISLAGLLVLSAGCSLNSERYAGVVVQTASNDCAPAALTMVLGSFGSRRSLADVRREVRLTDKGASVSEMIRAAGTFGLDASGWKCSFGALAGKTMPAVILIDGDHYVVVDSVRGGRLYGRDPAEGRISITGEDLQKRWDGTTILFQAGPGRP